MLIGEITPRASLEGVWHHPVVIESGGDHLCRPVTLEGHYHIDKPFEGTWYNADGTKHGIVRKKNEMCKGEGHGEGPR